MNKVRGPNSVGGSVDDNKAAERQPSIRGNDLLQGEVLPSLLKLSYPILIAMLFVTLFNIVDTF